VVPLEYFHDYLPCYFLGISGLQLLLLLLLLLLGPLQASVPK
jgi:hypothetical protein